MKLGSYDWIAKPFQMDEMVPTAKKALENVIQRAITLGPHEIILPEDFLKEEGYEADSANNGSEAFWYSIFIQRLRALLMREDRESDSFF